MSKGFSEANLDSTEDEKQEAPEDYHGDVYLPEGKPSTHVADPSPVTGLGGAGGKGEVAVDTEMLRAYAAYLDGPIALLKSAYDRLDHVDPRSGAFHQAFVLNTNVGQRGEEAGLRANYRNLCDKLQTTLMVVRDGVRKMALDYETTEEINGMTADQLYRRLTDLQGHLDGVGNRITDIDEVAGGGPKI